MCLHRKHDSWSSALSPDMLSTTSTNESNDLHKESCLSHPRSYRQCCTITTISTFAAFIFLDWENINNKVVCFWKGLWLHKREFTHDILIELGVQKTFDRLINTCLDGTQNKVRIGNYFSFIFPIENGIKQGVTSSPQTNSV